MAKLKISDAARFDVIATNIKTGAQRILGTNKTEPNAEAFIKMTIARLGVDEEFYSSVPAGSLSSVTA